MIEHIAPAMTVFGQALDSLTESTDFNDIEKISIVQPNITCQGRGEVRWKQGETLFKYLKKVSVPKKEGGPPIEFNSDGSFKSVEIRIVNLQLDVEASKTARKGVKKWEEIGVWQASKREGSAEKEDPSKPYTFGEFFLQSYQIINREVHLLLFEEAILKIIFKRAFFSKIARKKACKNGRRLGFSKVANGKEGRKRKI